MAVRMRASFFTSLLKPMNSTPDTLFNICSNYVADNLHLVESFRDLPEMICEHLIDVSGKLEYATEECSTVWKKLFEAHPNLSPSTVEVMNLFVFNEYYECYEPFFPFAETFIARDMDLKGHDVFPLIGHKGKKLRSLAFINCKFTESDICRFCISTSATFLDPEARSLERLILMDSVTKPELVRRLLKLFPKLDVFVCNMDDASLLSVAGVKELIASRGLTAWQRAPTEEDGDLNTFVKQVKTIESTRPDSQREARFMRVFTNWFMCGVANKGIVLKNLRSSTQASRRTGPLTILISRKSPRELSKDFKFEPNIYFDFPTSYDDDDDELPDMEGDYGFVKMNPPPVVAAQKRRREPFVF